jgi:hypothetical protein
MEERTAAIVGVRDVHVAKPRQRPAVGVDWQERVDRDLDVDDRFRREASNRRRSVVIDPARCADGEEGAA